MSVNSVGLLALILFCAGVIIVASGLLSRLFPRMRRSDAPAQRHDALPWYPAPKREVSTPMLAVVVNPAYWRSNVRLIVALVILWLGLSCASVLLSPSLNAIHIFTGFPLGYYMSSQGLLLVFLGLIVVYVWRAAKLDRQHYPLANVSPGGDKATERGSAWRIGLMLIAFVMGFLFLLWLMGQLEARRILPDGASNWGLLLVTVGVYALIGFALRTKSLDEYFVAGRRIPAFFNGMAIAGDWMSAASFISMAGTLWLLGYEGLAYILGWTGGYVGLSMLIAPYLRKFGKFTIPDFIAERFDGNAARGTAAVIGVIISFTYVTAQVTGIGIIMSRFLGVNYLAGVLIGLGSVLFCSFLGGMRAITWTQVTQCLILLIAYLVPVTILSLRATGIPIPQIMYGVALDHIASLESVQGIASYITPFNDWSPWNFLALMLCLMLGTMGMPHILIRFYTVPDAPSARRSSGWALAFILVLYLTAPAYAAFSRWEVLENVIGKPIQSIPAWAARWATAGLLTITDRNNDGVLQFDELKIDSDLVVLATPEIAGLPQVVAALVTAGGLAAALSTADGLLMVIASALSHDIYARTLNPKASNHGRLLLGRAGVFLAAVAAAFTAVRRLGIIVNLVAWAFSFAAATFFPVLLLGIFWKRANGKGAVAGMICGLTVTLAYMLVNITRPELNILGISNVAAGIFGMPVNVLVMVVVSLRTRAPSADTMAMVDGLRQP